MNIIEFTIASYCWNLTVQIDYDNLNIQIKDSYRINSAIDLEIAVNDIMGSVYFKKLAAAGYTRTKKSLIREWRAHNVLYRWGIAKERTGSVDMSQHESALRRFCYFFLSWFY